jgi:hypothetical protein
MMFSTASVDSMEAIVQFRSWKRSNLLQELLRSLSTGRAGCDVI